MAKTDSGAAAGKEASGTPAFLIAVALLTIIGAGAGFLAGHQLKQTLIAPATPGSTVIAAQHNEPTTTQVLQTPSVVTNLAGGKHWIRLDVTVLLSDTSSVEPGLANELSSDVTALVRTLSLQQISGPAGFQHLREELQERLALRSSGRLKEVTIQAMIIE